MTKQLDFTDYVVFVGMVTLLFEVVGTGPTLYIIGLSLLLWILSTRAARRSERRQHDA